HVAAALGAVVWAGIEWFRIGRPTALGAASGLVAGLVAITPAAGFVSPTAALFIGAAAGVACYTAVAMVKSSLQYDDTLDAFGVHGVCGFLGAVLTGVFASKHWNPAGKDGLIHGNAALVTEQLIGLSAAGLFAALVTWVLLKVIDLTIGLRADLDDELDGLDLSQHGEQAYSFSEGPSGIRRE
ncbi:MAG TPA: ammonia channel protein, partial [Polyangiaceae bacterium]|nr:ammonia channel protein [Polyangiaceae bacterium]